MIDHFMKERLFLVILLAILSLSSLACSQTPPPPPLPTATTLTPGEAINLVSTYGVPAFQSGAVVIGNWNTQNKGGNRWEVQAEIQVADGRHYRVTWVTDGKTVEVLNYQQLNQPVSIPPKSYQQPAINPPPTYNPTPTQDYNQLRQQQDAQQKELQRLQEEQKQQMRKYYQELSDMYSRMAQQAEAQYQAATQRDSSPGGYLRAEPYYQQAREYRRQAGIMQGMASRY